MSLSALEFILAQAPRSLQGLLIGLWYAFQSLSVPIFVLASYFGYYTCSASFYDGFGYHMYFVRQSFFVAFTAVTTILSIVSLISFLCVSKWYKYRKREESADINRYSIIEQYTERQLLSELQQLNEPNEESLLTVQTVL